LIDLFFFVQNAIERLVKLLVESNISSHAESELGDILASLESANSLSNLLKQKSEKKYHTQQQEQQHQTQSQYQLQQFAVKSDRLSHENLSRLEANDKVNEPRGRCYTESVDGFQVVASSMLSPDRIGNINSKNNNSDLVKKEEASVAISEGRNGHEETREVEQNEDFFV
jgi:hypothetical protein